MWIFGDRYDKYDVELARMLTEYRVENKFLNQRIADLERLLSLAEKMCDTLKEQKEKSLIKYLSQKVKYIKFSFVCR